MSVLSTKAKAVQIHDEFKIRADEITKLDLENLKMLKSLKKKTPLKQTSVEEAKRQQKCPENVDVNNFRQRQKLFDTVRELERASTAKFDDIQETINLSMKRNKLQNELNQKRFDELRSHFDTLYHRAMGFANNADPDRWLQLLQS